NFGADLAKKWQARGGREMFGAAGGTDNRLADTIGPKRLFDFHDPVALGESHLADYSAAIMFYNELSLFVGEQISDLYRTRKYFGSPIRREGFAILESKLDELNE